MRATKLAEAFLQDRKRRQDNKPKTARQRIEGEGFDPFASTRWRVIAVGEKGPGYLPRTAMRMGLVGWFVACWHCKAEFESRGLGYCPKCLELAAETRRANRKPQERSRVAEATGHRVADVASRAPSLQPDGTEIIEETPPLYGFADWPTILIGSGRRGRSLPRDLVENILGLEGGWLFDKRRTA